MMKDMVNFDSGRPGPDIRPIPEKMTDAEAAALFQEVINQGLVDSSNVSGDVSSFIIAFTLGRPASLEAKQWLVSLLKNNNQDAQQAPPPPKPPLKPVEPPPPKQTPPPVPPEPEKPKEQPQPTKPPEEPKQKPESPEPPKQETPIRDPAVLKDEEEQLAGLVAAHFLDFTDPDTSKYVVVLQKRDGTQQAPPPELLAAARAWLKDLLEMKKHGFDSSAQRKDYRDAKDWLWKRDNLILLVELNLVPGLTKQQFEADPRFAAAGKLALVVTQKEQAKMVGAWINELWEKAKNKRVDGKPDALSKKESEDSDDFFLRILQKSQLSNGPVLLVTRDVYFEYRYWPQHKTIGEGLTLLSGDSSSRAYRVLTKLAGETEVAVLLSRTEQGKKKTQEAEALKETDMLAEISLAMVETKLYVILGLEKNEELLATQQYQRLLATDLARKFTNYSLSLCQQDLAWLKERNKAHKTILKAKINQESYQGKVRVGEERLSNYYWKLQLPDFASEEAIRVRSNLLLHAKHADKTGVVDGNVKAILDARKYLLSEQRIAYDIALAKAKGVNIKDVSNEHHGYGDFIDRSGKNTKEEVAQAIKNAKNWSDLKTVLAVLSVAGAEFILPNRSVVRAAQVKDNLLALEKLLGMAGADNKIEALLDQIPDGGILQLQKKVRQLFMEHQKGEGVLRSTETDLDKIIDALGEKYRQGERYLLDDMGRRYEILKIVERLRAFATIRQQSVSPIFNPRQLAQDLVAALDELPNVYDLRARAIHQLKTANDDVAQVVQLKGEQVIVYRKFQNRLGQKGPEAQTPPKKTEQGPVREPKLSDIQARIDNATKIEELIALFESEGGKIYRSSNGTNNDSSVLARRLKTVLTTTGAMDAVLDKIKILPDELRNKVESLERERRSALLDLASHRTGFRQLVQAAETLSRYQESFQGRDQNGLEVKVNVTELHKVLKQVEDFAPSLYGTKLKEIIQAVNRLPINFYWAGKALAYLQEQDSRQGGATIFNAMYALWSEPDKKFSLSVVNNYTEYKQKSGRK